jgi:hypothetical protein
MKKVALFSSIILCFAFTLTACGKPSTTPPVNVDQSVAETGKVLDLTNQNNQTINASLGDVLYLALTSKVDDSRQWSVASTTSLGSFNLKDHKITDVGIGNHSTSTSEWWLKVEKPGNLVLQFGYGKINAKVEQSFKVIIVSQ